LLTKNDGPFLVMAHVFRGEGAKEKADALAWELRQKHGLPAFLYYLKPTRRLPKPPDEFAVMVDGGKSMASAQAVRQTMKKIKTTQWDVRRSKPLSLSRSILTMNPLVPHQKVARLVRTAEGERALAVRGLPVAPQNKPSSALSSAKR
jgi:hypothetical protein